MSTKYLTKPVMNFLHQVETTIRQDSTVEEALTELRTKKIQHDIVYFYVVDDDGRLMGFVPTRKLLLSLPDEKITKVMNKAIVTIDSKATLKDALDLFEYKKLLAIPVVDDDNKLLGAIDIRLYTEGSHDVAESDKRHLLFQYIGFTVQQLKNRSILREFSFRMPWLLANIVGGLTCAVIASMHEVVLAKAVIIAMFIPLVLTLSEGIAVQTMTLTQHYLSIPRMSLHNFFKTSRKEFVMALLLGSTSAVLAFLISLFFGKGLLGPFSISIAVFLSMLVASVFGIVLPVVLHALRLDPKFAAGPIVLFFTDVCTTSIYFVIGAFLLG